jgi:hypothetical protein
LHEKKIAESLFGGLGGWSAEQHTLCGKVVVHFLTPARRILLQQEGPSEASTNQKEKEDAAQADERGSCSPHVPITPKICFGPVPE